MNDHIGISPMVDAKNMAVILLDVKNFISQESTSKGLILCGFDESTLTVMVMGIAGKTTSTDTGYLSARTLITERLVKGKE